MSLRFTAMHFRPTNAKSWSLQTKSTPSINMSVDKTACSPDSKSTRAASSVGPRTTSSDAPMWDCNHFKKRRSTISISIYMFEKGRMPGAGQLVSRECREQRTNRIDEPQSTSDTGAQDLFAGKESLVSRTPPVPPHALRSSHRVQDSARHMDRASSRSSPHHINRASVQQFSEQEPTRKSLAGSERTRRP